MSLISMEMLKTNYDPTISMPMSRYAEAIVSVRDETIDSVIEIIDEIDDDQDIKFGIVTYEDGKDELRQRILALKGKYNDKERSLNL